ncbi:MAG: hypothetical protein PHW53_03295 [Patescibacteria group bacterium]|nr:hypothetical protein [Patescibacteria group bacterium]
MKKESWKIMFACGVGAFIGSLIALELKPWLIWVGLITGGLVGYLAYDFRRVIGVIPAAYRAARGWRPDRRFWKTTAAGLVAFFCFFLDLATTTIIFFIAIDIFEPKVEIFQGAFEVLKIVTGATIMCISTVILLFYTTGCAQAPKRDEILDHHRKTAWTAAYCLAPPIVLFYHLPRGMWWLMKRTPRAMVEILRFMGRSIMAIGRGSVALVRFLGRFGWQVFVRIHSERRALCFTDAVIGSVAGYVAGSAIIGALAGGLIGLVNYELVTRRWLIPRGYVAVRAK